MPVSVPDSAYWHLNSIRRASFFALGRLMNKIRPGSIARIDLWEDGMFHTSNITKFLESCFGNGFPLEDLFLRDDLIHATPDSLARVANTIIALVAWAKIPTRTHVPRMRRGAIFERLPLPPSCRSKPAVDPRDSFPRGIQSIGQPGPESNTNPTRNRRRVSSSTENSTIKNQSSMRNQSTDFEGTKESSTPKRASFNSTYSSLRDASIRNESISGNRYGTNPYVPLVEISVDSPIVLGGRVHTRNHNKSRLMLVMKEGKGWNKFVRVSTLLLWSSFCGLVDSILAAR